MSNARAIPRTEGPKHGNMDWIVSPKDPERNLSDGEIVELIAAWLKGNRSYKRAANELEISTKNALRYITEHIRDHPESLADMTPAAAYLVWICEVLDKAQERLAEDIETGKLHGLYLARTTSILRQQEAVYGKVLQPKEKDGKLPDAEALAELDEEIARHERGDAKPTAGPQGAEAPAPASGELASDDESGENGAS